MKTIDIYRLDGQLLRTFLIVLEHLSVSLAAERLNVTQSTVRHALKRLRDILGDGLFVRSGHRLTPTETAISLNVTAQEGLDRFPARTDRCPCDPKSEFLHFVIAANDLLRDLIFPHLMKLAPAADIDLSLELRPSGVPSVGFLRDARCDLILTPLPPDAPDLIQQKLFSGEMKVFFDAAEREAPKTIDAYLSSGHVTVNFTQGGASIDVLRARDLPKLPKPKLTVSNFSGLPPLILGTRLITTQVELKRHTSLKSLVMASLPFEAEPIGIFMVWHDRSTNDPAHKWLRDQVKQIGEAWRAPQPS